MVSLLRISRGDCPRLGRAAEATVPGWGRKFVNRDQPPLFWVMPNSLTKTLLIETKERGQTHIGDDRLLVMLAQANWRERNDDSRSDLTQRARHG